MLGWKLLSYNLWPSTSTKPHQQPQKASWWKNNIKAEICYHITCSLTSLSSATAVQAEDIGDDERPLLLEQKLFRFIGQKNDSNKNWAKQHKYWLDPCIWGLRKALQIQILQVCMEYSMYKNKRPCISLLHFKLQTTKENQYTDNHKSWPVTDLLASSSGGRLGTSGLVRVMSIMR